MLSCTKIIVKLETKISQNIIDFKGMVQTITQYVNICIL